MPHNHVTYSLSENDLLMVESVPPGGNWKDIPEEIPSKRLEQIRKSGGRTTLYGRLRWDKPSFTITTYFNRPGNGTYIHPDEDRVISAREAARLQSFPDDFIFYGSKTSFCKQIGNAVPPLLAFSVAQAIKKQIKVKNVLDLFCGAGGLSKGFEWAKYRIVAANDNFKAACETYKENHKKTLLIEGSILNDAVKGQILRIAKKNKVDIIIGGPPCQGFSYAGKRQSNDPRNFLYKEFIHIVKEVRPKAILMENVEGILTSHGGKTYEDIKKSFAELGYELHGKKMHTVRFGIPQKRKRVIIIGLLKGSPEFCFPKELIIDESNYITVHEAMGDLPPICKKKNRRTKNKSSYQKFISGQVSAEDYIKSLN